MVGIEFAIKITSILCFGFVNANNKTRKFSILNYTQEKIFTSCYNFFLNKFKNFLEFCFVLKLCLSALNIKR